MNILCYNKRESEKAEIFSLLSVSLHIFLRHIEREESPNMLSVLCV